MNFQVVLGREFLPQLQEKLDAYYETPDSSQHTQEYWIEQKKTMSRIAYSQFCDLYRLLLNAYENSGFMGYVKNRKFNPLREEDLIYIKEIPASIELLIPGFTHLTFEKTSRVWIIGQKSMVCPSPSDTDAEIIASLINHIEVYGAVSIEPSALLKLGINPL